MTDKKLIMTLIVRDEADIIRHNIDFHLRMGVDFIIATDSGSTDGTRDILKEYEDKGILHFISEKAQDHSQAAWMNHMGRMARERYAADLMFHCDADEFWLPKSGNLKTGISNRPEDILSVDAVNVLLREADGKESFTQDTRYAVVSPVEPGNQEDTADGNFYLYGTPSRVIFKTGKKLLKVAEDNHKVVNKNDSTIEGRSDDITIFHFPVRSKTQFYSKVINAGRLLSCSSTTKTAIGTHLKRWFDKYQTGLLDEEYNKIVLGAGAIESLLRKGIIEEIDFDRMVSGSVSQSDRWIFYNRKFEYNEIVTPEETAWHGHTCFAYDLVRNTKPKVVVELGTHKGHSFFSFCQAVKDGRLDTELFAVDTWKGDEHAGYYDDSVWNTVNRIKESFYRALPITLMKKTFDEAAKEFRDESIDILHIDGFHTYEAVKNDFERWFAKLKPDGIVLLHDIVEKGRDFGVYRFWGELKEKYRTLEFHHSHGLGVLYRTGQKNMKLLDFNDILRDHYPLIMDNRVLDSKVSNLSQQLDIANRKIYQMESSLSQIHASLSWRITAPLRKFKERFPQFTDRMKHLFARR